MSNKPLIDSIEEDISNVFGFVKGLINGKCVFCNGTGLVVSEKDATKSEPCPKCQNKGLVK